jgi:hypothetical protein
MCNDHLRLGLCINSRSTFNSSKFLWFRSPMFRYNDSGWPRRLQLTWRS